MRLLGAGGMGEVYQARDSRLGRMVALKLLPRPVATSVGRRERFEREARAIAALNHPNICNLYDVGAAHAPGDAEAAESVRFLVMEHVDGETLAERLVRGPLPIADVVRYAAEIADALDHAHGRGLVHRDLKPENVMLTATGVKLLDFGLSKLQPGCDVTTLATVSGDDAAMTADGALLGTFPYMAPEQLAGGEADARSDIFALGATIYEMAAGQRAFAGATPAMMIGAVLHQEPPALSSLVAGVPPSLERVVWRCLSKDPYDRWQTARDVHLELRSIAQSASTRASWRNGRQERVPRTLILAAALAVITVVAAAVVYLMAPSRRQQSIRLAFAAPRNATLADLVIGGPVIVSPDGSRLAFIAKQRDGTQLLWVRSLDSLTPQALAGTEGAAHPFWSPDSTSIGFFAHRKLKRVDVSGGPPQTLCDATLPRGGAWSRDGIIIFAAGAGRGMYRVPAAGGTAMSIAGDGVNRERYWPSFLPDGRRFMYFGRPQKHGIYLASIDSPAAVHVLDGAVAAAYTPMGYLLALVGPSRGAPAWTLLAYEFDEDRVAITGDPVPVAERVSYESGLARGAFSVSATGILVYSETDASPQLQWFGRNGVRLGHVGESLPFGQPALSPDERTVAVEMVEPSTQDQNVWLIDLQRNVPERFTAGQDGITFMPVWSPDGKRVVFTSARGTPPNLYQRALGATGADERLLTSTANHQPTDWSRDGRVVVFAAQDAETQWDLWMLPMNEAEATPVVFLQTVFNEHLGRLSPDGHWLAYVSDESGANEIYVRSFPTRDSQRRISTGGGNEPRWRGDGRELFYRAPDGTLMGIDFDLHGTAAIGEPTPLFRIPPPPTRNSGYDVTYTVTRDGQRFLVSTPEEGTTRHATIVLDWFAALQPRSER